jgi:hypothetical protein
MAHFYQTARRHTPEDDSIYSPYCPNPQYDVFRENWFSAMVRETESSQAEASVDRNWTSSGSSVCHRLSTNCNLLMWSLNVENFLTFKRKSAREFKFSRNIASIKYKNYYFFIRLFSMCCRKI